MAEIRIEGKEIPAGFYGHLYLVYVDDAGAEYVIRGGPTYGIPPFHGNIIFEIDTPISQSEDYRPVSERDNHGSRVLDLDGQDPAVVWQSLIDLANDLQAAEPEYDGVLYEGGALVENGANSNTTIAYLLKQIDILIENTMPGPVDGVDPPIGNPYPGLQVIDHLEAAVALHKMQPPLTLLEMVALAMEWGGTQYHQKFIDAIINSEHGGCFTEGTLIDMWDGSKKPIEKISTEDIVVSYADNGELVPGRVTQTFIKSATHVLDVFGLQVTPGHVTLCGDGEFSGKHVPIIDILRSDGALVREDGTKVRACTGCEIGSPGDDFIFAITGQTQTDGTIKVVTSGRIRLGTRIILSDGRDICISDLIKNSGGIASGDGLIRTKKNGSGRPFYWNFSASLPLPEDYILKRSQTILSDIYASKEWEGIEPIMPSPVRFNKQQLN